MTQQSEVEYFMQTTFPVDAEPLETSIPSVYIPMEWIAYGLLIFALIVLRVANLDTAPMSDLEADQAMSAWDAVYERDAQVNAISAQPLVFYGQVLAFSTGGTSEQAARFATAIAGLVLALTPLLFYQQLGRTQTFLLCLMWGLSPIALAASRTSDYAVWTAMLAVLGLWAGHNAYRKWLLGETGALVDATASTVFFVLMVFVSGSYGAILGILLVVSVGLVYSYTQDFEPIDYFPESDELNAGITRIHGRIFLRSGIAVGVVLALIIASAFVLNRAGLSMVGESLLRFSEGGVSLPLYPLLVVLVYDLGTVILGMGAYVLLRRVGRDMMADRFAIVLAIATTVAGIFYPTMGGGYGLFIVLPLGWLVSRLITELLVDYETLVFWDLGKRDEEAYTLDHTYMKWVLSLVFVGILVMLGTHWQEVGRGLLSFAPAQSFLDNVPRFFEPASSNSLRSLIWLVMSTLFTIVGALLIASIYGNQITLQGIGLGFFAFSLVSGLGGGWNAVTKGASHVGEIWQTSVVRADAYLLRDTLYQVANLISRGEPDFSVAVVTDEEIGLENKGLVAWLLRDFEHVRFVSTIAEAARDEVIITRHTLDDVDLGGSYVGQNFTLRDRPTWGSSPISDLPSWLAQRRVRDLDHATDQIILWVRLDIYNSTLINVEALQ